MILRQYLDTDPVVAASYLIGCGGQSVGAVIDPTVEAERYVRDADQLGVRIRYVIDTHVHADHISGGPALAARTDAEYVLFSGSGAQHEFRGVRDGDVLELGNVRLDVLHTPGHTPEHIALLGTDRKRGEAPWFVVTGHTLMVGDMGRTELATSAEQGARDLFRTARRLRELPDHVEILPGAFSGSVCGRGLSGKAMSTIGFERRFNRSFSMTDESAFVELMLTEIPPRPPRSDEIRAHNLGMSVAAVG